MWVNKAEQLTGMDLDGDGDIGVAGRLQLVQQIASAVERFGFRTKNARILVDDSAFKIGTARVIMGTASDDGNDGTCYIVICKKEMDHICFFFRFLFSLE